MLRVWPPKPKIDESIESNANGRYAWISVPAWIGLIANGSIVGLITFSYAVMAAAHVRYERDMGLAGICGLTAAVALLVGVPLSLLWPGLRRDQRVIALWLNLSPFVVMLVCIQLAIAITGIQPEE